MDDLEKLQAQIADLQRQAEDLLIQKKAVVVEELKAKIKAYGLTLRDLGFAEKVSVKPTVVVAVKYRHPDNRDLSWTGRGRQPKWVVAYIESGGTIEDLLV
jgi:DNA-binding protein H-NS